LLVVVVLFIGQEVVALEVIAVQSLEKILAVVQALNHLLVLS
jgi:hypothetical protein